MYRYRGVVCRLSPEPGCVWLERALSETRWWILLCLYARISRRRLRTVHWWIVFLNNYCTPIASYLLGWRSSLFCLQLDYFTASIGYWIDLSLSIQLLSCNSQTKVFVAEVVFSSWQVLSLLLVHGRPSNKITKCWANCFSIFLRQSVHCDSCMWCVKWTKWSKKSNCQVFAITDFHDCFT